MPEPSLRDRAAALAGELIALKREAAVAGDQTINQRLKEVTRILKHPRGEFSRRLTTASRERIAEELYGETDSQEQVVIARKESLTASVRRTVEAELEAQQAELQSRETLVALRERDVTERERQAQPSYRATFAAAGAGVVLVADVLLRVVA